MAEDEVDVTKLGADGGIICAETEARKILGAEVGGDGFETVVPAARAFEAEASFAER